MTERTAPNSTRTHQFWRQFRRHRGALIGGCVFAIILLGVLLGPMLWTVDPGYPDIRARNQGSSWLHPLGTDQLGRDTLARLMAGGAQLDLGGDDGDGFVDWVGVFDRHVSWIFQTA